MGKELELTQTVPLRKSAYMSVRMALRLRYHVPKEYKKIFHMEGDATRWAAPIKLKAKRVGMPLEDYEAALECFKDKPTIRLAILLLRVENDFLVNWWKNIKLADNIDNESARVKALLQVEREKMMGIKRLVETGRMIDPDQYQMYKKKKPKPKSVKPLVDDNGIVLDVEKIPYFSLSEFDSPVLSKCSMDFLKTSYHLRHTPDVSNILNPG
jgi:hypothetical protein